MSEPGIVTGLGEDLVYSTFRVHLRETLYRLWPKGDTAHKWTFSQQENYIGEQWRQYKESQHVIFLIISNAGKEYFRRVHVKC